MSSPQLGGGVNLVSSTSAGAIGKEVTSADFVSESVEKQAETQIIPKIDAKLTGKANADLSNCTRPYVVEIVGSGTNWCKVYSNGFKEQWGYFTSSAQGDSYVTVALMKPFSNTNYFVMNQQEQSAYTTDWGSGCASIHKSNKTVNSFELSVDGCTNTTGYYWYACGY